MQGTWIDAANSGGKLWIVGIEGALDLLENTLLVLRERHDALPTTCPSCTRLRADDSAPAGSSVLPEYEPARGSESYRDKSLRSAEFGRLAPHWSPLPPSAPSLLPPPFDAPLPVLP